MRTFKKILPVLILSVSTAFANGPSGWPVYDGSAAISAIKELAQLKRQYDMAKQTFEAMSGKRRTSFSVNDLRQFQQYFPAEVQAAMDYGFDNTADIAAENLIYSVDGIAFSKDAVEKKIFENQRLGIARNNSHWENEYNESKVNFAAVEHLIDATDKSPDLKTSVDIAAKAMEFNSLMTAKNGQMFALAQLQANEQQRLVQQAKEAAMVPVTEPWPRMKNPFPPGTSGGGYYTVNGEFIPN